MLGASKDQLNRFELEHPRSEIEQSAIMTEINYLKKCKKKLPTTFDFITIPLSNKGRMVLTWHPAITTSRVIDDLLKQCYEMLVLVREDYNTSAYNQESEKRAIVDHQRISKALILQMNKKIEQKHYKRIQINF